jgi:hypothetical protein
VPEFARNIAKLLELGGKSVEEKLRSSFAEEGELAGLE